MDDRVSVEFRVPSPALAPYFSTFYEMVISGDEQLLDCLPPEWANIQTGIDQAWDMGSDLAKGLVRTPSLTVLRGPTRKPTWVRGLGRIFGFGILPTGWSRLWQHPCHPYADRFVCLSDLVRAKDCAAFQRDLHDAADFDARIAIAEAWLSARVAANPPLKAQALIDRLYAKLNDPDIPPLEDLADWLELSTTQFARLCKRGFGFPPKLLLRRQRFMRMLGEMHSRPYSEWRDFIDPLYVDQSHMLRDFRDFLGMSPTAYFALPRPILQATTRARAAAAGRPYQILHEPDLG
jgi:AraC-like DNA-binding protein